MGAFSMYVCGLGDVRALFFRENTSAGLTPAYGLRRAKIGFGTDGGFLCVRLHRGDIRA